MPPVVVAIKECDVQDSFKGVFGGQRVNRHAAIAQALLRTRVVPQAVLASHGKPVASSSGLLGPKVLADGRPEQEPGTARQAAELPS